MQTEAAILVETGKPLELVSLEIPALKPGQVFVEIAYSGACGTQVMEAKGMKGEDKWLPHCMGHEGSATVLEVGSAVTKVVADDQVILSWIRGSGQEAGGANYLWDGKNVNAGGVTTFQRHAIVSENRLTKLMPGCPMDLAILLGCAAPTGMGAVYNVLNVRPGQSCAIFGTGGIGLNACMAAALAGADPVIAIDPSDNRRDMAKKMGATHAIDPTAVDVGAAINEICPEGLDYAVEASGLSSVMGQALECVRQQGGKAVVIGNAAHGEVLNLNPGSFNAGKSLMGTWGGDSMPDRDYARYAKLISNGRFATRELLSRPYRLDEINDALNDLSTGSVGRPLVDMSL